MFRCAMSFAVSMIVILSVGLVATAQTPLTLSLACTGNDLVINFGGFSPGATLNFVADTGQVGQATVPESGSGTLTVAGPGSWTGVSAQDGSATVLGGNITCPESGTFALQLSATLGDDGWVHVVLGGETLATIAAANGIHVNMLLSANPEIGSSRNLRLGTVLIVPRSDDADVCEAAIFNDLHLVFGLLEDQQRLAEANPDLVIADPRPFGRQARQYVQRNVSTFRSIDRSISRAESNLGEAQATIAGAETALGSDVQVEVETAAVSARSAANRANLAVGHALSVARNVRSVARNGDLVAELSQEANALNIAGLVNEAAAGLAAAENWVAEANTLRDEIGPLVESVEALAVQADFLVNRAATPEERAQFARDAVAVSRQAVGVAERAVALLNAMRETGVYSAGVTVAFEGLLSDESPAEAIERRGNAQSALDLANYQIRSAHIALDSFLARCPQYR